jgi:hypothetical protein
MSSARKRSFQPEISGIQLEGRQLLTAAGGLVAGKAAVLVGHPNPGGHILPIQTPEAVTAKKGVVVSHPRPHGGGAAGQPQLGGSCWQFFGSSKNCHL